MGIYRDETTADKLIYNPNDDTQNNSFFKLQLVVESFGHSTNQSKFKKSPQSCSANEYENTIIKL